MSKLKEITLVIYSILWLIALAYGVIIKDMNPAFAMLICFQVVLWSGRD